MKKVIISSVVAMVAVAGLLVTPTEACFGLKFNWFFGWNPGTHQSTPPANNNGDGQTDTPVVTTPVDTSSTPVTTTTPVVQVVQASVKTATPAAPVATPTAAALPKTGISDTAVMLAIVAVVAYAGAFAVMRFAKQQ